MIDIKEISNADGKSNVCNAILRALPDWFGVEESIVDYVQQVRDLPFYAAFDGDKAVGFVAVKNHTTFASEVCVMGILDEYHRQGIGKKLIIFCEQYCKENKIEFLTVKTLAELHTSGSYKKTRLFYLSVEFKPIEVFPLLWDECNPCLLMVKVV